MSDPKNSLYGLVQQANVISKMLAESGGEITPELETLMTQVDVALPEKIDGYHVVMERLEIEAKYWKDKAALYSQMAKSHAGIVDRLNTAIKNAMKSLGVTEIKGNEIRFKLANAKPSLLLDEANLDPTWKMTVTETVPDKERIRAALQEGAVISGAALIESQSLRAYVNKKEK